jgi:hypothetical protein
VEAWCLLKHSDASLSPCVAVVEAEESHASKRRARDAALAAELDAVLTGRGSHSSTSQLKLSLFRHKYTLDPLIPPDTP